MMSAVAAFFDVDGTITRTTILHPLLWYERGHRSRLSFAWWWLRFAGHVPGYYFLDRRDRAAFNHVFYRWYAGLAAAEVRQWHRRTFADNLQKRIYPEAAECIRRHQQDGHAVVFVTGGLDFVVRPLADHLGADEVIAMELVEKDGRFTGELSRAPVTDEEKGRLVREYAEGHGVDLRQSWAYGNNWSDLALLSAVGHPVAVNPDRRLRHWAEAHGWNIRHWSRT